MLLAQMSRGGEVLLRLRYHLLGLSVVTAVPILALAAVLIVQVSRQGHATLEQGARQTSRALTLAVDRELRSTLSALHALATSSEIQVADLGGFVREAQHLLVGQPSWYTIVLLDPSGQQLVNLAHSRAPLPSSADRPFFQEVLRTGQPVISDLLTMRGIGVDAIVVAVPVTLGGSLRYVLAAAVRPAAWAALLSEQRVAPEVTATILDRRMVIIARTRRAGQFVGQPAPAEMAARHGKTAEGWGRFVTMEGTEAYAAFSRSALSGWTVVLGTPAGPVDAAMRRSLTTMIGAAGLVLLLSGVAAALLSSRITRSILAASRAAVALGRGEPVDAAVSTPITEIRAMGTALAAASELLQQHGRERARLLAVEQAARAEAEASLARVERLQAIVDPMLSDFGLEDLLPHLLRRLRATLRADSATLLLLDQSGDTLRVQAADGVGADDVVRTAPVTEGIGGRIVATGEPLVLEDVSSSAFVRPTLAATIRSVVGTPLRVDARVIGVIHLGWVATRRSSEEDVQLLGIVADRVALAIRHAELDEAAAQARAAAEAASRERDQFFAAVSHELRTPLSAITTWAHILGAPEARPALIARAVAGIRRSVDVLARLSGDLGELARAQTGSVRLQIQSLEVTRVLREAVDTIRPSAEAKGVAVREEVPAGGLWVAGDEARLQQVFGNLLANAVKFTPPGGLVTVRADVVEGHAEVQVADTGRGISADFLPRVFERFSQAERGEHGGLGLGLSIVAHLVQLHGGTVRAESPGDGKGSTFTVALPLTP
jgi:signal transduction histidine kinase